MKVSHGRTEGQRQTCFENNHKLILGHNDSVELLKALFWKAPEEAIYFSQNMFFYSGSALFPSLIF